MQSLREHIDAVVSQELFQGCNFKLAASCGFDSLSVHLVELKFFCCKFLVDLQSFIFCGFLLWCDSFARAVPQNARQSRFWFFFPLTKTGKFCPASRNQFSRCVSLFPSKSFVSFIHCVICLCVCCMYCTGGVRCKMASAYIRSKGEEFEKVYQVVWFGFLLFVQWILIMVSSFLVAFSEAFPEGEYFHGKNFVFNHRMSMSLRQDKIVGCCYSCKSPTMTILHGIKSLVSASCVLLI